MTILLFYINRLPLQDANLTHSHSALIIWYMRYLYGDLTEFPSQENSLDLLKRFVDMAVEILKQDQKKAELRALIEEDREYMIETLTDIEKFKDSVQITMQKSVSGRFKEDVVRVMAQGADEKFSSYIADSKSRVVRKTEQRIQQTENEIDSHSYQILGFLKAFFMSSSIPVGGNSLRCTLDDQVYRAQAEIVDVTGIRCAYMLDTAASEFFSGQKRFSDLVPGKLEFPVGKKKSWLKKEPVKEYLRIDDATLAHVLDEEETGEFRLAKRAGNGVEGLLVRVHKGKKETIEVFRIDAEGSRIPVDSEIIEDPESEVMICFWKLLLPSVLSLYRTRGDLNSISIGDKDVVKDGLIVDLVRKLTAFLSPTIREIDSRSPAKEELCLKLEHENGKREEIYIQKSTLVNRVLELPSFQRSLFAPLGIDPGMLPEDEAREIFDEDHMKEPPTEPRR